LSARFSQTSKECSEFAIAECGSFAQNSSPPFSFHIFIIHALFSNRPLSNGTRVREGMERAGEDTAVHPIKKDSFHEYLLCAFTWAKEPAEMQASLALPTQSVLWKDRWGLLTEVTVNSVTERRCGMLGECIQGMSIYSAGSRKVNLQNDLILVR
jgi:hypothetical protein